MATAAAIALGAIGVLFAADIAALVLGDRAYTVAVVASFVWLPVNVAVTLALDLLRLEFRAVSFTAIGVGRTLLASALGVALVVWAGLGVEAVLISQVAFGVVGLAVALTLTRDTWLLVLDAPLARRLLTFGVPLVPAGIFYWVITYSDRFFLAQFRDIADVGQYAIANRFASLLQLLTLAFETAWYPFAYASADRPDHRAVFARVLNAAMLLLLPLAAALGLFAREGLLLFTTPAYLPAYPYVGILALALVAGGAVQIFVVGVQLSRRTWYIAWTAGAAAALNILLNVALIPPLGLLGAALSTLLSYVASATLLYVVGRRVYPIPYRFGRILTLLLVAGVALGIGLLLDSTVAADAWRVEITLLKAGVFTLVGAFALWLLDFAPLRLLREISSSR
jgi:O-antigen/teichoic acid export membrane protein